MSKQEAKAKMGARVVAKVIRADGTEETFVSEDVSVADADTIATLLAEKLPAPDEDTEAKAEEAHAKNEAESAKNEALNAAEVGGDR